MITAMRRVEGGAIPALHRRKGKAAERPYRLVSASLIIGISTALLHGMAPVTLSPYSANPCFDGVPDSTKEHQTQRHKSSIALSTVSRSIELEPLQPRQIAHSISRWVQTLLSSIIASWISTIPLCSSTECGGSLNSTASRTVDTIKIIITAHTGNFYFEKLYYETIQNKGLNNV